MSDSARRRRRKKQARRTQRIINGIIACAAGIILVSAGILVWNGVIHRDGPVPGQPGPLKSEVCYHDITLSWEPAKKADGYAVYMADGESATSEFEKIAEIEGGENCKYQLDQYAHDQTLRFVVAAYGENFLTGHRTEGECTDMITAEYDSDKYAQKIPVLTYHELIPEGYTVKSSLTVAEDMFDSQMQYLKDEGFRTLSMDEFYQWHRGKLEVPPKSVVITFDDGADNVYYLGYPILKKKGLKATVFCIGHHLEANGGVTQPYTPEDGVQRRFARDVLEKLRAEYPDLALESHTYNMHKRIDGYKPVNKLTYEEMMQDFAKNKPYDFHYIAYPWGANNKALRKAVKDSGYRLGFGYEPFRYATRDDDPYVVRRIKVSGFSDMDSFIQTVNGERPDDE